MNVVQCTAIHAGSQEVAWARLLPCTPITQLFVGKSVNVRGSERRGARTTKAPSLELRGREFADFKLFRCDQLLFQLCVMTEEEEEDAPCLLNAFSPS